MTLKLFHENPDETTFQGKVVDIKADNGRNVLILDRTCFYPGTGGQICDIGRIDGIFVEKVEEKENQIIHFLEKEISVKIGEIVNGEVDWETRFDHMQQHTGQHILSGAIMDLWKEDTLSFHMSREYSTLDIPNRFFDHQIARLVEDKANRVIFENRIIRQYYIENNEQCLRNIAIRRKGNPDEKIRMVEIDHFDLSACGGTHCRSTGEVGIIKLSGWENRKDKIRLYFVCGFRALRDYQKKHDLTSNLSHTLTTGYDQIEEKIAQMIVEHKKLSSQCSKLEIHINNMEAKRLQEKGTRTDQGIQIISEFFPEKKLQSIRQLAMMLTREDNQLVILGAEKPEPMILLACSQNCSIHAREVIQLVTQEYCGKGGGSPFFAMSKLTNGGDAPNAFRRVKEIISQKYNL